MLQPMLCGSLSPHRGTPLNCGWRDGLQPSSPSLGFRRGANNLSPYKISLLWKLERSWYVLEFARSNSVVEGQWTIQRWYEKYRYQTLLERLLRECMKILFRARYNLFLEPVVSYRYRRPWWGKLWGSACSYTHTNCSWYKNQSLMIQPC
jgi:hypothetical protein